jgi:hypothetical protein
MEHHERLNGILLYGPLWGYEKTRMMAAFVLTIPENSVRIVGSIHSFSF